MTVLAEARMDRGYVALLVVAAIVAALGLEQNSAATIIGAMVVAPLMPPIRSLGYGLVRMDGRVIRYALVTLIASTVVAVAIGAIVGLASGRPDFGSEIQSRTSVTFLGLAVAIAGGALAGLSRAGWDSKITDALIGVGIAVSLIPPLCTVGICLAYGAYDESWGALSIFLTNAVGISFSCSIAFWCTGYASASRWKPWAGMAVFALAIAALSPELARAGMRARETNRIAHLVHEQIQSYLPSTIGVESIAISWREHPHRVLVVIRVLRTPTRAEVRALNAALNRDAEEPLQVTIAQDLAPTITP